MDLGIRGRLKFWELFRDLWKIESCIYINLSIEFLRKHIKQFLTSREILGCFRWFPLIHWSHVNYIKGFNSNHRRMQ